MNNLIALMVLAFFISFPVDAQRDGSNRGGRWGSSKDYRDNGNKGNKGNNGHSGNKHNNTIGAPLDGGLLTVLGAAGVAYFVSRKKKKNGEVI